MGTPLQSNHAMPADAVPSLLRRMNARKVLEAVQDQGPSTRAELTRMTGISPPTVSLLVEQLVMGGMLERDPRPREISVGRPGVRFRLARRSGFVVGAVIDMKSCTVVASGLDGQLYPDVREEFETPDGYESIMERMRAAVGEVLADRGGRCLGLGLSVPGLIDRETGEVLVCPNVHALDGKRPGNDLGLNEQIPVAVLHEEYALSVAAQRYGPARGISDFVLIDLCFGLGTGVYTQGRYLEGFRGLAGELGHVTVQPDGALCGCGNRGCLETVATDQALLNACSNAMDRTLTMSELIRLCRDGSFDVTPYLNHALDYLAIGVSAVVNIFNPSRVLLHGQMFDLRDDVMDELHTRVARRALTPSFDTCELLRSEANKDHGAIAGIIEHLYKLSGPPAPHDSVAVPFENRAESSA